MSNIFENKGAMAATIVVAASDSLNQGAANYVCDGVADDVEIQAAIDALPANGGKVLLLEGNYTTIANIIVPANATLEGQGKATIITPTGAAITNGIVLNGDNITLKDMKIILAAGAGAGGSRPNVVWAQARTKLWIENLWAVGDTSVPDDGSAVRQCGIFLQSCTYSKIINCDVRSCRRTLIYLYVTTYSIVSGNTVQASLGPGIFLYSNANFNIVEANICQGNDIGIALYESDENTISANVCEGNLAEGIFILAGSNHNTVVGNICRNNVASGIHLNSSNDNTVTGNTCEGNSDHGIHITTSDRIVITGNTVRGSQNHNIYLYNSSYCTINGNVSADCVVGDGINIGSDGVAPSNYNVVSGNLCNGNAAVGASVNNGINTSRNFVGGNQLIGNGTQLSDVGANTIISREHSDVFMDVLAVSANHVVNAQTLAADPTVCAIAAQPDVPRTLSYAITHPTLTAFTLTFVGVNAKGRAVTEVFTQAGGWTGETFNAFATVTSITMSAMTGNTVADTIDVGITDVLGLSNEIYETADVYKIKKNNANAVVAAAQVNVTYDTYDMAVIGLAVGDDFTIWFRSNLNILS